MARGISPENMRTVSYLAKANDTGKYRVILKAYLVKSKKGRELFSYVVKQDGTVVKKVPKAYLMKAKEALEPEGKNGLYENQKKADDPSTHAC